MRSCARARALAAALVLAAPGFARAQPPAPAASVRLLDVPYIQQSEALCGGAAVAMVMRYWGATGVYAETFAPLVDKAAGGIRGEDLLRALSERGWNARAFRGDRALVQARLAAGQPVIALIEDRPGAYHYVVLVAWANGRIIQHDPARAPFRVISEDAFLRAWERAERWALLALPPPASADRPIGSSADRIGSSADRIGSSADRIGSSTDRIGSSADRIDIGSSTHRIGSSHRLIGSSTACDGLVGEGVTLARAGDHDGALRTLAVAADACPDAAAPWREMAGVYAVREAWQEAARHAGEAVRRAPEDELAWRILATSRYVTDDFAGALEAWNAVGEPVLDIVNIRGLEHTRYAAAASAMRLQPQTVLTTAALSAAGKRLAEVPAAQVARVNYRPVENGRVAVDAVLIERPRLPFSWESLAIAGARALTTQELTLAAANPTGAGDVASASWRWWKNRPRIGAAYAAPLSRGGVLRTEVYRDEQRYGASRASEVRKGGSVSLADWTQGNLRWETAAGLDAWNERGKTLSLTGTLEQRAWADRVAFEGTATAVAGSFTAWAASAGLQWRSVTRNEGSVFLARAGVELASNEAPLALWSGAGVGHARRTLLRAHRLLDDGVITGEVFGRRVYAAGGEWRWWAKPWKAALRVAPAVFLDTARAERRLTEGDAWHADAGAGLRIAIPGSQVLRIDVARGLRDGKTVVSIGWMRQQR